MPAAFPRTLAALRADRRRGSLVALVVAIAIFGAWLAWALLSDVAVLRSSTHARVEVSPAPARVAAPVGGRVVAAHLQVGAKVAAGDVLVELDKTAETIAAERARDRVAALAPQVESAERELGADDAGGKNGALAEADAEREVLARLHAAEADLGFAERDAAREQGLTQQGVSSEQVRERAEALVKQRRAAFDAVRSEADALTASHRERSDGRRARREQLTRQRDELASALAAAKADADRTSHELERRTIRAPLAGTLGEVAVLEAGAVLHDGDVVTTVVPDGTLHVVAEYGAVALGRLAPGQPARVRLDGFPWTRYGTVSARVARVATELRDGTIRVELDLDGPPAIAVKHGMTGTVDVEVERASPAALLLRAIGGAE